MGSPLGECITVRIHIILNSRTVRQVRTWISNHELHEADHDLRARREPRQFLSNVRKMLRWLDGSTFVAACMHGAHRSAALAAVLLVAVTPATVEQVADHVERMRCPAIYTIYYTVYTLCLYIVYMLHICSIYTT